MLCDKPFALDADEAASLEAEARRGRRRRALQLRVSLHAGAGDAARADARRHVGSRRARAVDASVGGIARSLATVGWLFDRELGGGWVGAWGSHAVDQLRWLFATEVAAVDVVRRIDVTERPDAAGVSHACTAEDGFSGSLVLANGITVAIDSGFAAVTNTAPRFTVFGTEAIAELVADERLTIRRADGSHEQIEANGEADTRPTGIWHRCGASRRSSATRSTPARSRSGCRRSPTAAPATRCSTNCAPRRSRVTW